MLWNRLRPAQINQRGGVLVEVTIVIPLLVFLVLGTLELGLAFSDSQVVTQGARNGARTVSQMSNNPVADHEALLSVVAAFGPGDITLQRVTIFDAGPDGERPASCLGSTPVNSGENCNIYTQAQLTTAELSDPSKWGCGSGTYDDNWCPSVAADRNPTQTNATWIGVHVVATRQWQTGFFGNGTQTITETAVMRMEPRD